MSVPQLSPPEQGRPGAAGCPPGQGQGAPGPLGPRRAGACRQESERAEGSAAGPGSCRCHVGRCLKQGLPGQGGEEPRPPLKGISRPNWKVRVSGRRFGAGIAPFRSPFPPLASGAGNVSPPSFVPLPVCTGKEPTRGQAAPGADRPAHPRRKGLRCLFKKPRHRGTHFSALRQDKEPGDGPGCPGSPPRRLAQRGARRRTGHRSPFAAVSRPRRSGCVPFPPPDGCFRRGRPQAWCRAAEFLQSRSLSSLRPRPGQGVLSALEVDVNK